MQVSGETNNAHSQFLTQCRFKLALGKILRYSLTLDLLRSYLFSEVCGTRYLNSSIALLVVSEKYPLKVFFILDILTNVKAARGIRPYINICECVGTSKNARIIGGMDESVSSLARSHYTGLHLCANLAGATIKMIDCSAKDSYLSLH